MWTNYLKLKKSIPDELNQLIRPWITLSLSVTYFYLCPWLSKVYLSLHDIPPSYTSPTWQLFLHSLSSLLLQSRWVEVLILCRKVVRSPPNLFGRPCMTLILKYYLSPFPRVCLGCVFAHARTRICQVCTHAGTRDPSLAALSIWFGYWSLK